MQVNPIKNLPLLIKECLLYKELMIISRNGGIKLTRDYHLAASPVLQQISELKKPSG